MSSRNTTCPPPPPPPPKWAPQVILSMVGSIAMGARHVAHTYSHEGGSEMNFDGRFVLIPLTLIGSLIPFSFGFFTLLAHSHDQRWALPAGFGVLALFLCCLAGLHISGITAPGYHYETDEDGRTEGKNFGWTLSFSAVCCLCPASGAICLALGVHVGLQWAVVLGGVVVGVGCCASCFCCCFECIPMDS